MTNNRMARRRPKAPRRQPIPPPAPQQRASPAQATPGRTFRLPTESLAKRRSQEAEQRILQPNSGRATSFFPSQPSSSPRQVDSSTLLPGKPFEIELSALHPASQQRWTPDSDHAMAREDPILTMLRASAKAHARGPLRGAKMPGQLEARAGENSSRDDAQRLASELRYKLARSEDLVGAATAKMIEMEPSEAVRALDFGAIFGSEWAVWDRLLRELVRQVSGHCFERGVLLERARVRASQCFQFATKMLKVSQLVLEDVDQSGHGGKRRHHRHRHHHRNHHRGIEAEAPPVDDDDIDSMNRRIDDYHKQSESHFNSLKASQGRIDEMERRLQLRSRSGGTTGRRRSYMGLEDERVEWEDLRAMISELQDHNTTTTTAMYRLDEAAAQSAVVSSSGNENLEGDSALLIDEETFDEDELENAAAAAAAAASAVLEASAVYRRTNETSDGGKAFKELQVELAQRNDVISRIRKNLEMHKRALATERKRAGELEFTISNLKAEQQKYKEAIESHRRRSESYESQESMRIAENEESGRAATRVEQLQGDLSKVQLELARTSAELRRSVDSNAELQKKLRRDGERGKRRSLSNEEYRALHSVPPATWITARALFLGCWIAWSRARVLFEHMDTRAFGRMRQHVADMQAKLKQARDLGKSYRDQLTEANIAAEAAVEAAREASKAKLNRAEKLTMHLTALNQLLEKRMQQTEDRVLKSERLRQLRQDVFALDAKRGGAGGGEALSDSDEARLARMNAALSIEVKDLADLNTAISASEDDIRQAQRRVMMGEELSHQEEDVKLVAAAEQQQQQQQQQGSRKGTGKRGKKKTIVGSSKVKLGGKAKMSLIQATKAAAKVARREPDECTADTMSVALRRAAYEISHRMTLDRKEDRGVDDDPAANNELLAVKRVASHFVEMAYKVLDGSVAAVMPEDGERERKQRDEDDKRRLQEAMADVSATLNSARSSFESERGESLAHANDVMAHILQLRNEIGSTKIMVDCGIEAGDEVTSGDSDINQPTAVASLSRCASAARRLTDWFESARPALDDAWTRTSVMSLVPSGDGRSSNERQVELEEAVVAAKTRELAAQRSAAEAKGALDAVASERDAVLEKVRLEREAERELVLLAENKEGIRCKALESIAAIAREAESALIPRIEAYLLSHDDISEAYVLPRPMQRTGHARTLQSAPRDDHSETFADKQILPGEDRCWTLSGVDDALAVVLWRIVIVRVTGSEGSLRKDDVLRLLCVEMPLIERTAKLGRSGRVEVGFVLPRAAIEFMFESEIPRLEDDGERLDIGGQGAEQRRTDRDELAHTGYSGKWNFDHSFGLEPDPFEGITGSVGGEAGNLSHTPGSVVIAQRLALLGSAAQSTKERRSSDSVGCAAATDDAATYDDDDEEGDLNDLERRVKSLAAGETSPNDDEMNRRTAVGLVRKQSIYDAEGKSMDQDASGFIRFSSILAGLSNSAKRAQEAVALSAEESAEKAMQIAEGVLDGSVPKQKSESVSLLTPPPSRGRRRSRPGTAESGQRVLLSSSAADLNIVRRWVGILSSRDSRSMKELRVTEGERPAASFLRARVRAVGDDSLMSLWNITVFIHQTYEGKIASDKNRDKEALSRLGLLEFVVHSLQSSVLESLGTVKDDDEKFTDLDNQENQATDPAAGSERDIQEATLGIAQLSVLLASLAHWRGKDANVDLCAQILDGSRSTDSLNVLLQGQVLLDTVNVGVRYPAMQLDPPPSASSQNDASISSIPRQYEDWERCIVMLHAALGRLSDAMSKRLLDDLEKVAAVANKQTIRHVEAATISKTDNAIVSSGKEKVVFKVGRLDACRVLVNAYEELETAFEDYVPSIFNDACRQASTTAGLSLGDQPLRALPQRSFATAMRPFKSSWQAEDLARLWNLGIAEGSEDDGHGGNALTLRGFDMITDFTTCIRVYFRLNYLTA